MTGLDVRIWMMQKKLKATQIATEYKCDDSFVSRFLNGKKTSQDLVDYLTDKGCPKEYFRNGRVAA